jgi:hypothetical protein
MIFYADPLFELLLSSVPLNCPNDRGMPGFGVERAFIILPKRARNLFKICAQCAKRGAERSGS